MKMIYVSAYRNGRGSKTFGINVGKKRDTFFAGLRKGSPIVFEIDDEAHTFVLAPSFWRSCPEIRRKFIREWLRRRDALEWEAGDPPKFKLVRINKRRFRLEDRDTNGI